MKRSKILFCIFLLIGIIFIPFFAGCSVGDKVRLVAPSSVEYQIDKDTGFQIIYVKRSAYASKYLFAISETETDNLNDFIKYEVPAKTETGQDHNYLDVTNIFKNAKTYYFYAQYIGEDRYITSSVSKVSSVDIYNKLDTPTLNILDTTLNWTEIENVKEYAIYSSYGSVKTRVATTTETTYNVANFINEKIASGLNEEISFSIYAIGEGNYITSAESNFVTFDYYLQLETPSNLEFISGGNKKYLQWNAVRNCDNYTIKINYIEDIILNQNDLTKSGNLLKYEVTSYVEDLGDYVFSVKANNTGNYIESGYSNEVTYTHTQKLSTPTNVTLTDLNPYVEIMWDAVENADIYELYVSDIDDNYQSKKITINIDGVESEIVTNCVKLTYAQLGITSINQVSNQNFKVQVRALGYSYYLTSSFSNTLTIYVQNLFLSAPVITDNSSTNTISWNDILLADRYKVKIESELSTINVLTTNNYFDYSSYLINPGEYTISCLAMSGNDRVSAYSNSVSKTIYGKLSAPVIESVTLEDDSFVIEFVEPLNASKYTLFVNNNLVSDDITITNYTVPISNVIDYAIDRELAFSMFAQANGYFTQSNLSNKVIFRTKLDTLTISISGSTLSWTKVDNATDYNLILDDECISLSSTENSVNLDNYVGLNVARQVMIQATNPYLESSNFSNKLFYNHLDQEGKSISSSYTNNYFYYGQTYDYYITSEEEMFAVFEYNYLNFRDTVNLYINFDSSTSIYNKVDRAYSGITGTRYFRFYCTNSSSITGETTLTYDYKVHVSDAPNYTSSNTQYEYDMVYRYDSTRDSSYQFKTDNSLMSQDVWTTDGLLSAVQHGAKPNFMTSNSVAEQVYNEAKDVLVEICDDEMTDYQKALAIHDWIIENVAYDYYGRDTISINTALGYFHFIESALLYGLAVCDGYAKTYALLCNMEGIDCIVINGNADGGHSWNKIYLDHDENGTKDWFAVDLTWDDVLSGSTEYLRHSYFLIPDSYIGDRTTEKEYVETTVDEEKFYSFFKYDGVTLLIDSDSKLYALKSYLNSHSSFKIEILIKSSYMSSLGVSYSYFSYYHNNDYNLAYIHRG